MVKIARTAIAFAILILLSTTASSAFSTAHAQTNVTTPNQTGKTSSTTAAESEQASKSIRGAIISTGHFLNNATQEIAGSKSVQTIVNESSDLLGNATVATKKLFNPK